MPTTIPQNVLDLVAQMLTLLNNLQQFDNAEVLPVVQGLLAPTDREKCFTGTYYRSTANVRTAVALKHPPHFQAIAMLARSNIELAMDIKLLGVIPQAVEKMIAFTDSEKLKTAKKIIEFSAKSGTTLADLGTYQQYIAANETRVIAIRQQLWGFPQPPEHWSNMKIKDRAAKLGAPFEELYEVNYRHLSWQAHAGLTGVFGLEPQTFAVMCGDAFGIAATCYEEVLTSVMIELQLGRADDKVWDKLRFARLVSATNSPEQRAQLERALLG